MYTARQQILICAASVLSGLTSCDSNQQKMIMNPPNAEQIEKELSIHGHTRIDPYYWMNDREDPRVKAYLEAENAYTESMMNDTEELQETLFNEIVGRIKQEDQSVPYLDNGYFYYVRYVEGGEYPVYCRKQGSLDGDEEILLDGNSMAEGHDYFAIGGMSVSRNNQLLAYGVDTVSRRKYTLHIKNLETGEHFEEKIPVTNGYAAWANDNRTLFYTTKNEETLRPDKIWRHELGTPVAEDVPVYEEQDETFNTVVYKTKSEHFLVIASIATLSAEYRILEADNPGGSFRIFQAREPDHEFSIDHFGDHFYIVSNWNAQNFRLMKTPAGATGKENWTEVIPHREDVYLSEIEIFNDYLVVAERKEGLLHLRVREWGTGKEHYLDFGEEAYVANISVNREYDTRTLRYSYSSLTTPFSTYDYDMETREKTLMKQQEVLGDFNPDNYETRRVYAPADDGVKVPITLVYRKGMKRDGRNPTLLYAYGSYGHTIDPYFSSVRLSLLERGFIYAIAHVRGGQIYGRQWYEDGKMFKKKNTFTDFNDCAEYLIERQYTQSGLLFAQGGSAGGLLIGAVINMQPELYKGVIAGVPFVDVVTTMLDESIPLTTGEYDEWGNPNDKQSYEYMLSYSPYDNVEAKEYPNMLVTTGFHDSQVQYWEPAKWVARLRDMKTDDNLLLLHTNMEAGHGGKSGRFRRYRETALEYAFMLKLAGLVD